MIISPQHNLIFVKTWKTAGTSIEVFLSQAVEDDAIVTPIRPPVDGHLARNHTSGDVKFFNHMPASKIRARLGPSVWDGFDTFCVERNPWDQVVSTYFMRRARSDPELDWDMFIQERDFYRNHTQYTSDPDRSEVLVGSIVHYERLEQGLAEVFDRAGIPFDGSLGVRAKGDYRVDRRHYREHYTDRQAEIVSEEFATEIRINGYEF
jgi:hypothetical protein